LVAVGFCLLLSGCGVPTGGEPRAIDASQVPPGLLSASPSPAASAPAEPRLDGARVFLVDRGDRLVARGRDLAGTDRAGRLAELLAALASGPTSAERVEQLSTALPPDVRLTLVGLSDGTAAIDIAGPYEPPSGPGSRRAVAQIVLTATSERGVDAVRLTLAGQPVEAPLPSGQLTSAPLTAADYAGLLTEPAAPPS
jgi:hypothetical protein